MSRSVQNFSKIVGRFSWSFETYFACVYWLRSVAQQTRSPMRREPMTEKSDEIGEHEFGVR